jgi:hypothetical protein
MRKKQQNLPRTPFKEEGVDRLRVKRVVNSSHSVKMMLFMGIINLTKTTA